MYIIMAAIFQWLNGLGLCRW